jgi:hypothetical protein
MFIQSRIILIFVQSTRSLACARSGRFARRQENGHCPLSLLIRRRRYGKVPMLWFSSRPSRRRCPPCGGGLILRQTSTQQCHRPISQNQGFMKDGSPTALCLPSNGVGPLLPAKGPAPGVEEKSKSCGVAAIAGIAKIDN